jgi:hypothetical protein
VPVRHFDAFHELPGQVLPILQTQKLIFSKYGSDQQSHVSDVCCRPERSLLLILAHQGCPTSRFGIDAARFCCYFLVGKHALQCEIEQPLLLCL